MMIEPPTPSASASPDASTSPVSSRSGKPGSAVCCHALSLLSLISAGVTLVAAFIGDMGLSGPLIPIVCFTVAVLWWALVDIVAALARIARRS